MEANSIYNVTETRTNFRQIMSDASNGIIVETQNQTTKKELLNGLNSASKTNTLMGVATVAAVVISGAPTRSAIRN